MGGHFKSYPWGAQLSTGPFGHNGMQSFVGALEYHVLQTRSVDHTVSTAAELWRRRPFPDAQVVAHDGTTFAVHRAILASASPVLEATWRQPLRESEERVLRIDADANCDPGEMLSLAHLYGLPQLVKSSALRLASQVTASNAVAAVRALRPYR